VGRTSVQTHYTLRQVEADAVCAEGYATLVWYDMQARKAVPLPQQILAACKAQA
jgi:acyl-CoA thioesterase FadM